MAAPERSRSWKIVNHEARNACGEPVGYTLVPTHASAPLLAQPTAAITSRAAFATRHLWVTPARDDELRAAGEFPNQHPGGAGLPAWTAADRPVTDTSIALWHTVGVTHFCRPEDFPVMPVEYTGFTLRPRVSSTATRPSTWPRPGPDPAPNGALPDPALPTVTPTVRALTGRAGKWRRLRAGGSAIVGSGKGVDGDSCRSRRPGATRGWCEPGGRPADQITPEPPEEQHRARREQSAAAWPASPVEPAARHE